jgi:hypothetical protein
LFFDSFFELQNIKTKFYALHMFCRYLFQIFKMVMNTWNWVVWFFLQPKINQYLVLLLDSAYSVI